MKLGVLGGIGVEASTYFYQQVIQRLQKRVSIQSNTDYPQIIINSVPAPELHLESHIRDDVLAPYIKGVQDLAQHEPDFIVMVCNTIHVFLEKIKKETGYTSILSLPDVVRDAIKTRDADAVCVLGTGITVTHELYAFPDYHSVRLSDEDLDLLCACVVDYNNGGNTGEALVRSKQRLLSIVDKYRAQNPSTLFLLACTEISEIMGDEDIESLDTLECLINATVDRLVAGKTP